MSIIPAQCFIPTHLSTLLSTRPSFSHYVRPPTNPLTKPPTFLYLPGAPSLIHTLSSGSLSVQAILASCPLAISRHNSVDSSARDRGGVMVGVGVSGKEGQMSSSLVQVSTTNSKSRRGQQLSEQSSSSSSSNM